MTLFNLSRFTPCVVVFCLLLVCMSWLSSAVIAADAPDEDSLFYYEIGGGRDVAISPRLNVNTIDFALKAQASALSCSGFDPMVAIESSLDNIKNGVDNAINAIELAATAAIANLPGYILQKANPGLYDLFQNALLRANESFALATKNCERIQQEISQNINPFEEWATISWGDSWRRSVGIGGANIHDAVADAEQAPEGGVQWVGGVYRGGANQTPIYVLSDVATAGMNILSQRPPETTTDLPATAALYEKFTGPNAVDEWINNVLGDIVVGICDACDAGGRPGKGLIPLIEETTDELLELMMDLVAGNTPSTRENLNAIEAPGIAITLQVILAIRNLPEREQGLFMHKFAQEIAEARIMDQAMIIRRLLLAGRKEGNVSSNSIAQEEVAVALEELETEIANVIFEKDTRNKFVTNTVVELLLRDNATRQASLNTPAAVPVDPRPFENGGVPQ